MKKKRPARRKKIFDSRIFEVVPGDVFKECKFIECSFHGYRCKFFSCTFVNCEMFDGNIREHYFDDCDMFIDE